MSWFAILGIVVLVVFLPMLTGAKPEGTRPVAGTRLMSVARVILVLVALVILGATLLERV